MLDFTQILSVGLAVAGAGLGLMMFVRGQKKTMMKSRSAAAQKPNPAEVNPLLRRISNQLLDDLALPSKEFRHELGLVYPELAMAFRQSINFGLTRYCVEKMGRSPAQDLVPNLINRLLCDYYGFVLPTDFQLQDLSTAMNTYAKQKKILRRVDVVHPEGNDNLVALEVWEKGQLVLQSAPLSIHADQASRQQFVETVFQQLLGNSVQSLVSFRQTATEVGYVIVTAGEVARVAPWAYVSEPVLAVL